MIQESATGVVIHVRVIPRARKSELAGTREQALLIRLNAPPVEGAANAALCRFLADLLGVPGRRIRILSGEKGRDKRIAVDGLRAADARARLNL